MRKIKIIYITIFIFFSLTLEVYAYFDPGTGSFIVQSILAVLGTIAASLTITYVNFKNIIKKIFKKKKNKKLK